MRVSIWSNRWIAISSTLLLCSSCQRVPEKIEPKIHFAVQDAYLKQLPSPFPSLSEGEKREEWGKEFLIGRSFAEQLDLYQALTAFKRAEILAAAAPLERKRQIRYEILFCYYLGRKYAEVITSFEGSSLEQIDEHFPASRDLLILLYDSYEQLGEKEKAERTIKLLKQFFPETADKLTLSSELLQGDLPQLATQADSYPFLSPLLTFYEENKKSVKTAQTLNALLPGAGYLYLKQTQSALTAFLLNGLFIATAVYFYDQGNIPAGIITTSFEAGWYFGGIYGVGLETKLYNERVYERYATPLMRDEHLFPVLMLHYAF